MHTEASTEKPHRTGCGGRTRPARGSPLLLRERTDDTSGWKIADMQGVTVTRMSSKFCPPVGRIVAVRVVAILVRDAKAEEQENVRCARWELVLPEIEYEPAPSAVSSSRIPD